MGTARASVSCASKLDTEAHIVANAPSSKTRAEAIIKAKEEARAAITREVADDYTRGCVISALFRTRLPCMLIWIMNGTCHHHHHPVIHCLPHLRVSPQWGYRFDAWEL